jgi:hypothetical protein
LHCDGQKIIKFISSILFFQFETAEEAKLAREGLHNVVWPTASDAHLIVEYSSEDKVIILFINHITFFKIF